MSLSDHRGVLWAWRELVTRPDPYIVPARVVYATADRTKLALKGRADTERDEWWRQVDRRRGVRLEFPRR